MIKSTRRGFLVGCSAAIASYAGSRFNTLSFGDPNQNSEIMIVVFLRGGLDGLNLVPPIAGADRGHYEAARPNLAIPNSGPNAALSLNAQFGLHPSAAPLLDLYQNGNLAIVQAVGMSTVINKSHFDAMQFVELGTPGQKSMSTGWLTRHLQTANNLPTDLVMPSLAIGDLQPTSLAGELNTVNMNDPRSFNISNGPWNWRPQQKDALRSMFEANTSWLHDGGVSALNAVDIIESSVTGEYVPSNGASYPEGPFGQQLQVLAQMIKLDLGLQVATLDFGGWDTHESQGTTDGVFADQVATLSQGLNALYTDLDGTGASNYTNRLTVVAQSEFGRELRENGDNGTEHGYGNQMLVLSGNAIGGLHGNWPGLGAGQLIDGTDLAVTTDYRQVLSEILIRRMCNTNIETIFPGYTGYQPLGIVNGPDLPLPGIFSDGFESGNLNAWSGVVGG
ncbi:MAG: DUF1501 domain-containing protein [Acidobacteriota bacterium]